VIVALPLLVVVLLKFSMILEQILRFKAVP